MLYTGTLSGGVATFPTSTLLAGTHSITASYSGDSNDNPSASPPLAQIVNQATPTITWTNPAPITYGTALGGGQLDATTSVPGTWVYSPPAGTVLGAGPQTLSTTFTPTDSTDYSTVTATVTLTVNQATPTITWPPPSAITSGTPLSGTQLDATASVPGNFVYSPPAGTVLGAGPSQTLSTTFTPTDTTDYTTATASVTLTVTGGQPSITQLIPAIDPVGATVNITGQNFGTPPGTVTFNGTNAPGPGWGNLIISVQVPAGATTGPVVVTTAGGLASPGALFTIGTPPSIVAAASPAPNSNGWNNSPVTVVFTCTQGTLPIANCPGPQTVSTEGAAQVVTGTVTDTAGNAVSASVTVNLDMTPPVIVVSAPADMSTVLQSPVTITGSATDALSGTAQVTCGGVTATLASSAYTCAVNLNVGLSLIVIKATDAAGNVSASRLHLTLAGTFSTPNSLTVTPNGYNMVVGETNQFTAIDDLGRQRTDATWTVGNTNVATINTDSSPTLTAVAAGSVTLTATVESVTGQTTITVFNGAALPEGTLRWSAPPPAGYTVEQIVQAQATWTTPDLYAIATGSGSCNVTGLTAGGQSFWTTPVAATCYKGTPDASGGLLIDTGTSIIDLDGQTGTQVWTTSVPYDSNRISAGLTVGQTGNIYYSGGENNEYGDVIFSLDGGTGISNSLYHAPSGTYENYCYPSDDYQLGGQLSLPVVGPDGTIFELQVVTNATSGNSRCGGTNTENNTLSLVQISPAGATTVTAFKTDTTVYNSVFLPHYYSGLVIPDGQGGALVTWEFYNGGAGFDYHVADVIGSSYTELSTPGVANLDMVLGDNGTAFMSGLLADDSSWAVTAFNLSTMTPFWTYPAPAGSLGMNIIASSAGGGVVVKTTAPYEVDTVVRLDSNGQPTTDSWSGNGVDYFISDLWTDITPGGQADAYSAAPVQFSDADWFEPTMAGTKQSAPTVKVTNFSTSPPNQTTISNDLANLAHAVSNFPACSAWLQGGPPLTGTSASTYINSVLLITPPPPLTIMAYFGHGTFDQSIEAFSFTGGTTGVPLGTLLVVNDGSGFFTANCGENCTGYDGPQKYPGGTLTAQISILAHETAHEIYVIGFEPDSGRKQVEKHNQALVDQNCGALIETVGMVSPNSLTFVTQAVGTVSSAQIVTLTDNLGKDMTLTPMSITGANALDFAVTTTCGTTLAANAQCTASVTFKPQGTGARTATLDIYDSAAHSPQTVVLTGTGN